MGGDSPKPGELTRFPGPLAGTFKVLTMAHVSGDQLIGPSFARSHGREGGSLSGSNKRFINKTLADETC